MAAPKPLFALGLLLVTLLVKVYFSSGLIFNSSSSGAILHGIEIPSHLSFNAAEGDCNQHLADVAAVEPGLSALKFNLRHRTATDASAAKKSRKESVKESNGRDVLRIQALFNRIAEKKKNSRNALVSENAAVAAMPLEPAGRLMATLESGVALGSGEYFIDVFVGTPPRHFPLIVDTGSDLNWVQCLPCHDCFEQHGPFYDPAASSSYRNLSCHDPRCTLVSQPNPPATRSCRAGDESCPYFYWYGDNSNTTGDLALESFTMNLTTSTGGGAEFRRVENVIFGCGHWNRGLFHGAAGLLGLGRGPLSFSSQLRSIYGQTFSYCFVDRNSDLSVSSKLIFGEDKSLLAHPNLNFTNFVSGGDNGTDTFYYVQIKGILVDGEKLNIPPETWKLSKDGSGGTIVDSGTTLSYFTEQAYQAIKYAFMKKIKDYPRAADFLVLSPCYNVSGVEKVELPEFTIVFEDGTVWDFPPENYFIRLEKNIVCLAILGSPESSLSILGNYQQQNFHIMYDMKNSRLGFAPAKCAEV